LSGLFRKKAVENYRDIFSTDGNVARLSISAVVISVIFVIGVLLVGLWFFFGNILNTVEINGVVFPAAGIEKITATQEGVVSDIRVSRGEDVKVGDIIAVIPDETALTQLEWMVEDDAEEEEIASYRQKYENNSIIRAKSSGTIISVLSDGDYVATGDTVATVAARNKDDNTRQILAFLPTTQKNSISAGCAVQVSPNYAPREKYGYINGYISEIDPSVITKSDVQGMMEAYNIPSLLEEEQTYIAVYINLMPDEATESGLSWSVKQSGAIDVETGDLCDISVVESSQPPYKWLFGGA
jgi:multidrug resistance efflux pump